NHKNAGQAGLMAFMSFRFACLLLVSFLFGITAGHQLHSAASLQLDTTHSPDGEQIGLSAEEGAKAPQAAEDVSAAYQPAFEDLWALRTNQRLDEQETSRRDPVE